MINLIIFVVIKMRSNFKIPIHKILIKVQKSKLFNFFFKCGGFLCFVFPNFLVSEPMMTELYTNAFKRYNIREIFWANRLVNSYLSAAYQLLYRYHIDYFKAGCNHASLKRVYTSQRLTNIIPDVQTKLLLTGEFGGLDRIV